MILVANQCKHDYLLLTFCKWVEQFSLMADIICTRFPHKTPQLLAYQAPIVLAERNYEGTQWVSYDRRYWREALARKDLNWSVPDVRLYNEAFTGRAKSHHHLLRSTYNPSQSPHCRSMICILILIP